MWHLNWILAWQVHGGTNQISECLAKCIGNDRVLLGHPVVCIEQTDDRIVVRTLNGKQFHCKYLIMACPPAVQQKIHYLPENSLPPMRNQLMQRAPMGAVYKSIVYYERAFWREKNMCGSMQFIGECLSLLPGDKCDLIFWPEDWEIFWLIYIWSHFRRWLRVSHNIHSRW